MVSIIKNQILKHLSKFTKNLSPDKINVSTLKGEGELSNLELDENILMDLMELPTWMRLIKAICNKVSIKIQWTKLKSQPICLYLDEVVLEIETCEEPRSPCQQQTSHSTEGKYGFVDKVIDGMYVHINAVSVKFISQKFLATVQLSRVVVQSLTPTWNAPTDLRQTRIRDPDRDELLLFKEVDWQTTRIEANAREEDSSLPSTPLRLIANQSKIRITLKKRLSDCSIISSRVILLLDDLLWVLTDTQLKAAILYANSLSKMIEKSTEQSKRLAAKKLQKQGYIGPSAEQQRQQQQQYQQQRARAQTTEAKLFTKFDVATTSYHLITSRIDLHLCDDLAPDRETSPKHNKQIDGGAMQIVLSKLSLDFYPFHPAGGERKQWYRYTDNQGSRNHWVQQLFKDFKEEVSKARETCSITSPSQSPSHAATNPRSPSTSRGQGQRPPQPGTKAPIPNQAPARTRVTKLLESCMVVRIEEFIIYRVSTADNKRSTPQKFFCSDKKALHLPADMSMIHIEYTDYFFTDNLDYPVPHANMYVLVNPVRLTLDYLTLLWANYFSLNLAQMVESQGLNDQKPVTEHLDVKIEAVMPRIVIPAEEKVEGQPDRPESIQLQMSKLTASNSHVEDGLRLSDLQDILNHYKDSNLFDSKEFPNEGNKLAAFPPHFEKLAKGAVNPYIHQYTEQLVQGRIPEEFLQPNNGVDFVKKLLHTNALKKDAKFDLWGVKIDQVWLEFLEVPSCKTRPFPFLESLPLSLWMCRPSVFPESSLSNFYPEPSSAVTLMSAPSREKQNGHVVGVAPNKPVNLSLDGGQTDVINRPSKRRLKEFYSSEDSDSSSQAYNGDSTQDSQSNSCDSSPSADKSFTSGQCGSGQFADMNILVKVGSKVRAQLNHYQYLFLMRLLESLSNFQTHMKADVESFMGAQPQTNEPTFSIPLILPELEFAMVNPYIAELLPLTDNSGVLCSPLTESSDERDGFLDTDTDMNMERSECSSLKEEDEIITVTQTGEGSVVEITDTLQPDGMHMIKSQSDSKIGCHIPAIQKSDHGLNAPERIRRDSHSTEELTTHPADITIELMGRGAQSSFTDSSMGSFSSSIQRSRSHSKVTNQVKKSFTSAMSNMLPDKFKNKLDIDDDDSDRLSIRTDMSDEDDFEFLLLDDTEVPAFNHIFNIETASSTGTDIPDDLSSMFADTTSASKAKELVSVVVFRLSKMELLLQSTGQDIIARIQAQKIDTDEPGNIIYENFYTKFSQQKGCLTEPAKIFGTNYPVRFKYVSGPSAAQMSGGTAEGTVGTDEAFMDIQVVCTDLSLKMSSVTNLSNFVEDEKTSTPAPMRVEVRGLHLTLNEDRPPQNVTSPGNLPLNLDIQQLYIQRFQDGVFHMSSNITPAPSPSVSSASALIHKDVAAMKTLQAQAQPPSTMEPVLTKDEENIPAPYLQKLTELKHQNAQLHNLLEKLDQHTQEQEAELEKLPRLQQESDSLRAENDALKLKLVSFGKAEMSTGQERKKLEEDNRILMERLVTQNDEIENLTREKNSFLSTLNLMQEELLVSEEQHLRTSSHSSGS